MYICLHAYTNDTYTYTHTNTYTYTNMSDVEEGTPDKPAGSERGLWGFEDCYRTLTQDRSTLPQILFCVRG